MTPIERDEILSKDVLDASDVSKLLDISKAVAYEKIAEIKRKGGDRLGVSGKLHLQDYIDYYQLDIARYVTTKQVEQLNAVVDVIRAAKQL